MPLSFGLATLGIVLFLHRYVGAFNKKIERALIGIIALFALPFFYQDLDWVLFYAYHIWCPLYALIGVYSLYFLYDAYQSYQHVQQLMRKYTVAEERQRIMRDIHDGIGGQLVATLVSMEGQSTRII